MKTSHFELCASPSNSVRDIENQDGAVLLDVRQGLGFSINPVAAEIWHMIKERKSLDQIIDALSAEFNIPREQVRGDVMEFAALLNQKGFWCPKEVLRRDAPGCSALPFIGSCQSPYRVEVRIPLASA
jgi:coenzyme PQQ synthesis protein D (PqqD)